MKRMRRIRTHTLLVLCLSSCLLGNLGCFVFDELNAGIEIMDKHSSRPAPGSEPAEEEKSGGKIDLAALRERGAAQFGNLQERVEDAMRPKPHPDDTVVTCVIDGGKQFMRKFSCQSLGGRVIER